MFGGAVSQLPEEFGPGDDALRSPDRGPAASFDLGQRRLDSAKQRVVKPLVLKVVAQPSPGGRLHVKQRQVVPGRRPGQQTAREVSHHQKAPRVMPCHHSRAEFGRNGDHLLQALDVSARTDCEFGLGVRCGVVDDPLRACCCGCGGKPP